MIHPSNARDDAPPSSHTSTNGDARSKMSDGDWLEDLSAIGIEAARWIGVQADRARLRMRRRVFALLVALPLIAFGLTVAVLAGVELVRGVAGGWSAAFVSSPWLGQLTTAVTLMLGLLGALRLWMRADDARELRSLREKHEDEPQSAEPTARTNA